MEEHPLQGRVPDLLLRLAGHRFAGTLQVPAETGLAHRIHEQAEYHHHCQRQDPGQFLEIDPRHLERGTLEEPEPPFRRALFFVVRQKLVRGQVTVVRRQNESPEVLLFLCNRPRIMLNLFSDRMVRLHRLIRLRSAAFLCRLPGSCSDVKRTETELGVLL